MDLESIRRIVTGHDYQGKTIALIDTQVLPKQRSPGGNAISMLSVTEETPADLTVASDRADAPVGVPPPSNGSIFRIVDFPPASTSGGSSGHVDHNKILTGMGIDPAPKVIFGTRTPTGREAWITRSIWMERSICLWTTVKSI
jgi:hypothetical protein